MVESPPQRPVTQENAFERNDTSSRAIIFHTLAEWFFLLGIRPAGVKMKVSDVCFGRLNTKTQTFLFTTIKTGSAALSSKTSRFEPNLRDRKEHLAPR